MTMTMRASNINSIEHFLPNTRKFGKLAILDANDSFTHNLVQSFLSLGASVCVFRVNEVSITDIINYSPEYIVLSPGPGRPEKITLFQQAIDRFLHRIPILGVCLGMQAICQSLGGNVVNTIPVHGKTTRISHNQTGIFENVPTSILVARYHSLKVKDFSKEFVVQAEKDGVVMAFHIPKVIAGVQFHPESFLTEYGSQMLLNFLEGRF